MLDIIIYAIQNRQVLSLVYDGINRVVEPHAVGESKAGNNVLRCYQMQGGHVTPGHEWDLLLLDKIANLRTVGTTFTAPRPGYKKGDKGMIQIYAEL